MFANAVRGKLAAGGSLSEAGAMLEEADFEKMAQIRERIEPIVDGRAAAEALKP